MKTINRTNKLFLTAITVFAMIFSLWIVPMAGFDQVHAGSKALERGFENGSDKAAASVFFEENRGQFDKRVKYFARDTNGYSLFLTGTAAVYILQEKTIAEKVSPNTQKSARATAIFMNLADANANPNSFGIAPRAHKTNYFKGERSDWKTEIPNYSEVRMENVYDGIDAIWKGRENGGVQYDFVVAPNADATQVAWNIEGARSVEIDGDGSLLIETDFGIIKQQKPFTFQESNGFKQEVESRFVIDNGDPSKVQFDIGNYDRSKPLTIDPSVNLSNLAYSTLLGGGAGDEGNAIAVDQAGNAYVAGSTFSVSFPTTPGTFDTSYNNNSDAFVAKLNATGSDLVYSTFLGGNQDDFANAIAVDLAGNVYVTGETVDGSVDYPTTVGAYDTTHNGDSDVFVTKLNAAGTSLTYSTLIGGSSTDKGHGIAIDLFGNSYISGATLKSSVDYPVTVGAFDTTHNLNYDAFATKLNVAGSALTYSTYIGGSSNDESYSIAVDSSGSAFITGMTFGGANVFPTTFGAYDTSHNGNRDAFVTKLNSAGSALSFSTFLGGDNADEAMGIALDSNGNAYITGRTTDGTVDYPTTVGARDTTHNGLTDVFVTKVNSSGGSLAYSTFLGGGSLDEAKSIAVDASGCAFITGFTYGDVSSYPTTPGAFRTTPGGGDVFITKLNTAGSWLDYSTFIGGNGSSSGNGIAIDPSGNVFFTGNTSLYASFNFPTTDGAFDTTFNGGSTDAFAAKFGDFSISGKTLDFDGNPIANVRIALSGSSSGFVLSDASGFFTFSDTSAGNFAVSATRQFYQFNPGTFQFPFLLTNQNLTFVGLPVANGPSPAPADLGGKVETTVGNVGLANTRLTLIGTSSSAEVVTDENGDYEFNSVVTGAVYFVVPEREGYNFTPGIRIVDHYNTNLSLDFVASPTSPRPIQDFDGDGKTDLAVFRPENGTWHILRSQDNSYSAVQFGVDGDVPVAEDYDGDERADIAVFRPSNGNWYRLNSSNGSFSVQSFGVEGDKPVPADFDGDGKIDLAVYRPLTGVWHRLLSQSGSYHSTKFGISSDIPMPADFDNDGKADITVFRNGIWYKLRSSDGNVEVAQFGTEGDKPVAADFDGDGKIETAVFRPSTGIWYWMESSDGDFVAKQFGISTDIPVPADFTGEGRCEPAVFRNGTWYILKNDNSFSATQFGKGGDIPSTVR